MEKIKENKKGEQRKRINQSHNFYLYVLFRNRELIYLYAAYKFLCKVPKRINDIVR